MTTISIIGFYILGCILSFIVFVVDEKYRNKEYYQGYPMEKDEIGLILFLCLLWPITIPWVVFVTVWKKIIDILYKVINT